MNLLEIAPKNKKPKAPSGANTKGDSLMNVIDITAKLQAQEVSCLDELEMLLFSTDMKGWYLIDEADYHASSPISRSGLLKYKKGPANFLIPDPETRPMVIGRAFHEMLSVPEEDIFFTRYAIAPEVNKRTKAGKARLEEFMQTNSHKTVISAEEYDQINLMALAIKDDDEVKEILRNDTQHELSCFYMEENVWTKARIDAWVPSTATLVEFKTTAAASKEEFERSFFNYYYDVQAAFYMDRIIGAVDIPIDRYIFIAVEKQPPWKVYKLEMTEEVFSLGRARYLPLLHQHKVCVLEQDWPQSEPMTELHVPQWLLNKNSN